MNNKNNIIKYERGRVWIIDNTLNITVYNYSCNNEGEINGLKCKFKRKEDFKEFEQYEGKYVKISMYKSKDEEHIEGFYIIRIIMSSFCDDGCIEADVTLLKA